MKLIELIVAVSDLDVNLCEQELLQAARTYGPADSHVVPDTEENRHKFFDLAKKTE